MKQSAGKGMIMKDKANRVALRGVSVAFVISAAMLFVGGCGNSDPYMVIDISTGADGGKYPVSYMREAPQGGWGDEYKTTKIVLRRSFLPAFPPAYRTPSPLYTIVAKPPPTCSSFS